MTPFRPASRAVMPDGRAAAKAIAIRMGALVLFASCQEFDRILEVQDIQFFKVEEVSQPTGTALRLSGLAFHSALGVSNISVATSGDAEVVLIHLTPARSGLSGGFDHLIDLPATVTAVVLGNDRAVIWRRPVAPKKP